MHMPIPFLQSRLAVLIVGVLAGGALAGPDTPPSAATTDRRFLQRLRRQSPQH